MTYIPGTIVKRPLSPGNSNSKFGTHISTLGAGGLHEVETIEQRNAIPVSDKLHYDNNGSGKRRNGMLVYVHDGEGNKPIIYQLRVDNWTELDINERLEEISKNIYWVDINNSRNEYFERVYINEQTVTISHNWNKKPSVIVLDEDSQICIADVKYINQNTVRVDFVQPMSGTIILQGTFGANFEYIGQSNIVQISYEDLRALKNNYQLSTLPYYKIERKTRHLIKNTNEINEGQTEHFLIKATSSNTLDPFVKSIQYPNDIIIYDFDLIEIEDGTEVQGEIIYRKDIINNNEDYFDFRAYKVRRWLDNDGSYTELTENGNDYQDFSIFNENCFNNVIASSNNREFHNNIIMPNSSENYLGINCKNITIKGEYNKFEGGNYNISVQNEMMNCYFTSSLSNKKFNSVFNTKFLISDDKVRFYPLHINDIVINLKAPNNELLYPLIDNSYMISSYRPLTYKPNTPSNLDGVYNEEDNVIILTWQINSTNEEKFIIEKLDDENNWIEIGEVARSINEFIDSDVYEGENTYRVRAYSYTLYSDYSNELTILG